MEGKDASFTMKGQFMKVVIHSSTKAQRGIARMVTVKPGLWAVRKGPLHYDIGGTYHTLIMSHSSVDISRLPSISFSTFKGVSIHTLTLCDENIPILELSTGRFRYFNPALHSIKDAEGFHTVLVFILRRFDEQEESAIRDMLDSFDASAKEIISAQLSFGHVISNLPREIALSLTFDEAGELYPDLVVEYSPEYRLNFYNDSKGNPHANFVNVKTGTIFTDVFITPALQSAYESATYYLAQVPQEKYLRNRHVLPEFRRIMAATEEKFSVLGNTPGISYGLEGHSGV